MSRSAAELAALVAVTAAGHVLLAALLGWPSSESPPGPWLACAWWWGALLPLVVLAGGGGRVFPRMVLVLLLGSGASAALALILGLSGEVAGAFFVLQAIWGGSCVAVSGLILRLGHPTPALIAGLAVTLIPAGSPWWIARDRPVPHGVLHANPAAAVLGDLAKIEWFLAGSLYSQVVDGGGRIHYPRWFETLDCPVVMVLITGLFALAMRRIRRP